MARSFLTPIACVLAAAPLLAGGRPPLSQDKLQVLQAQKNLRADLAVQDLLSHRRTLGLSDQDTILPSRPVMDAFGMTHLRVRQAYKGVPVWGGDAILHVDAEGRTLAPTNKLVPGLNLAVEPALSASEALALAFKDMAPKGVFSAAPKPELVVVPRIVRSLRPGVTTATANASDVVTQVVGADLAWHLQLDVQSAQDSRSMDYLVSAANGVILKRWNSRETVGAVAGTGNSEYSGTVSITTNQLSASSYEMRDPTRGATVVTGFGSSAGSVVTDMANGTSGNGTLYTDADNTWGDGTNFDDGVTAGGTSGTSGQTVAVDAKYGFDATWDYYKNVHGRTGIDGNGTSTTLRMHYASNYDNAFWDDGCFCMTFGDGSYAASGGLYNLTAIDVIGHELSHGFCSKTAGLVYYDESGGLNEADSDINGTFITYYAYNGGTGTTVPDTIPSGGNHNYLPWSIGSQIANPPLRNMIKPSLDGQSADAWFFGLGDLNVHFSSGPMNRAMYYLAKGASSSTSALSYSSYLPSGMTGIGNDSASKIWYRAMTVYMTPTSNYHDARLACINAAIDLFPGTVTSPSPEIAAVQNAFHGINVGPVAGQPDDTQAPTGVSASESGTSGSITFSATATDNVGVTNVDFAVDGTFVARMTGTGSIAFDSHLLPNGTHSLIATAYDDYHNGASAAPVAFSTNNSYAQFLAEPGFELGGANWSFGGIYSGVVNNGTYAHGGTFYAIIGNASITGTSFAYQVFTLPASVSNSNLTLWTRISNSSYPTTDTSDSLAVQLWDSSLAHVVATLGTVTGKNATGASTSTSSWVKIGPFDLSAYKGQTLGLVLISTCNGGKTTFRVDDLGLTTQYALPDENGDGKVDGLDLGAFAQGYGTDPLSDFNNDGATDDTDANILLTAFGK